VGVIASEVDQVLDWDSIDTVLLDMDGTLLDLHFDNHFWLEFVPHKYAELKGIGIEEAKADCTAQTTAVAGTLDWYVSIIGQIDSG